MGEVYLAEDPLLDRRVALKRASAPTLASADARQRLRREARAAARLSHPHIASIHDVFEDDDQTYIVMEYVEGDPLADLTRRGPLPLERAITIGIDLADALEAAHSRGVIHRDLKPANIRLTVNGKVKILDFGISRVRGVTIGGDEQTAIEPAPTISGQMSGTPGYAAPEQLLGRATDARTDVYGLGAVLYECLAGQPPFREADTMATALAALSTDPVPLSDSNPAVPAPVASLVARAMAKSPADRYQSARELGDALRRLTATSAVSPRDVEPSPAPAAAGSLRSVLRRPAVLALLGLLVLGGAGAVWLLGRGRARPADVAEPAVAVVAILPPETISAEPDSEFLAVGIADSLYTDLAGLAGVTVIARADTRDYGDPARDRPGVARALGATYLVESTVQRVGDDIRVNARLLSADGTVVWRDGLDGTLSKVFDLQHRLARGVAGGLRVSAVPVPRQRAATPSVEALQAYWQGRTLLERPDRPDHVLQSISAFERAVEREPRFAEAHAGLGEALWQRYVQTSEAAWADKALAATEAALRIDPEQPRVWISLATVHEGTGQRDRALEDLERALSLRPNSDDAYRLMGQVLAARNRTDEALSAYARAIELRPGFWRNHHTRGILLYRVGRHDEAKEAFRTVIQLQPDSASGYQALGTVLQVTGDLPGARESYEKALSLAPSRGAYNNLATIYYWEKRYEDAARVYRQVIELFPRNPLYHRNLGDAYTRLGEVEKARASYGTAISLTEQLLQVNPNAAETLSDLAVLTAKLGRLAEAEERADRAAALAPDDAQVLYNRAVVHALGGHSAEALTTLKRAIAAGASAHLATRDDDLASLRGRPDYETLVAGRTPP